MKRYAFFVVGFLFLQFGVLNAATPYWWGSTLTPNYNDTDKVTQQKNNQLLSDIRSNGIPVTGLGFTGTVTMATSIGLAASNNVSIYSLTLSNQLNTLNAYLLALSNILTTATSANVNVTNAPTVNIVATNTLASSGNANVTNVVDVTANQTNAPAVPLTLTAGSVSLDTATASYQITNALQIYMICFFNTNAGSVDILFSSNGPTMNRTVQNGPGQFTTPANTVIDATKFWLKSANGVTGTGTVRYKLFSK